MTYENYSEIIFCKITNFTRNSLKRGFLSRRFFLHSINLNGAVCSNALFWNTSVLTISLSFRRILHVKVLEHLVSSNTSVGCAKSWAFFWPKILAISLLKVGQARKVASRDLHTGATLTLYRRPDFL